MNKYQQYIKDHFTNELKLLIHLSQNELDKDKNISLENINWDLFVDLCKKHRLVSHVLKHSNFLAEKIPIPVYEKLIEIRLDHSKKSLNYAVHAIRIYQQFTEQNIQHLFFKGPLLSLELYKDIGYRNFGDIDILVKEEDIEKAKEIIEELGFDCIYPKIALSEIQQKVNYSISHHYHFKHPRQDVHIELHWSITNPKSFFGVSTENILNNATKLKVSNYELPYISAIENIVYQAAHGAIHQFYRLFWLKDFSTLISTSAKDDILKAWKLSIELKLSNSFKLAFFMSNLFYHTEIPEFIHSDELKKSALFVPIKAIEITDLKQQGIVGKIKHLRYRLRLKTSFKYYFDLIYRLRTHLTDWELLKLSDRLFFLYYPLRPFLFLYQNLSGKKH